MSLLKSTRKNSSSANSVVIIPVSCAVIGVLCVIIATISIIWRNQAKKSSNPIYTFEQRLDMLEKAENEGSETDQDSNYDTSLPSIDISDSDSDTPKCNVTNLEINKNLSIETKGDFIQYTSKYISFQLPADHVYKIYSLEDCLINYNSPDVSFNDIERVEAGEEYFVGEKQSAFQYWILVDGKMGIDIYFLPANTPFGVTRSIYYIFSDTPSKQYPADKECELYNNGNFKYYSIENKKEYNTFGLCYVKEDGEFFDIDVSGAGTYRFWDSAVGINWSPIDDRKIAEIHDTVSFLPGQKWYAMPSFYTIGGNVSITNYKDVIEELVDSFEIKGLPEVKI